jgi:hypothetical protein
MDLRHKSALFVASVIVAALCVLPCPARGRSPEDGQERPDDIWSQGDRRGPGMRGGPRGFELNDEEIGRVMKGIEKEDPEKAKELAKLREEDPRRFQAELMEQGGEELAKIMSERIEAWRQRRQAEFLDWLEKNYRKEAEELGKLKKSNLRLYVERLRQVQKKYEPILEAERRNNPELAQVLREDLELKERREELRRRIRRERHEAEREKLKAELTDVVARRFDLLIRRNQIEFERLLRWIEELQKRVQESKAQIEEWQDEEFKRENVKKRVDDLIKGKVPFGWD